MDHCRCSQLEMPLLLFSSVFFFPFREWLDCSLLLWWRVAVRSSISPTFTAALFQWWRARSATVLAVPNIARSSYENHVNESQGWSRKSKSTEIMYFQWNRNRRGNLRKGHDTQKHTRKNHPIHVDGGKIATKMLTLIAFTNRMCVYESLNFPLPVDFYQ